MRKSPAQVYALTFGLALLLAGILGFFYNADFSTGDATTDPANRDGLIGVFDINGWHNVVHLTSGLLGLALAASWRGARLYAWGFGLTYLVVTVWGFVIGDGESILGLIAINTEDNFLHLAISLLGIGAALVTPAAPPPTTTDGERKSKAFQPFVRRRPQVKAPPAR
jgi:Domain of unknown function (DUF4383)